MKEEENFSFLYTMFDEPKDFLPDDFRSSIVFFQRINGEVIKVGLVKKHSLWAHLLWNSSKVIAEFLENNANEFVNSKNVLELGAGGALPSIIAALLGASKVVSTDYPEQELLENISNNFKMNLPQGILSQNKAVVTGHLWGINEKMLLDFLPSGEMFNLIILSDLIFNHSSHFDLLRTCYSCLDRSGTILVAFSHHRPKYIKEDLHFFDLARGEPFHFEVEKRFEKRMEPMFPDDPGSSDVRSTIHFYIIRHPESKVVLE